MTQSNFKINLQASDLHKAFAKVIGVVENTSTMPVLSNFLFQAKDGKFTVTASAIDREVTTSLPDIQLTEQASFTADAKKMIALLKSIPSNGELSLAYTANQNQIVIKYEKSKLTLKTIDSTDFPLVKIPEQWASEFSIEQCELKRLINEVIFAVGHNDSREMLNGVFFEIKGSKLNLVSSNGHHLALTSTEMDSKAIIEKPSQDVSQILSTKTANELQKILDPKSSDPVKIQFSNNFVRFTLGDKDHKTVFVSKVIEHKYVNYERVLESSATHDGKITINRKDFLNTLNQAMLLTDEKSSGVMLKVEGAMLVTSARNSIYEEAHHTTDLNEPAKSVAITVNGHYLSSMLSSMSDDDVSILYKDELSSIFIDRQAANRFKYVLMPMRS